MKATLIQPPYPMHHEWRQSLQWQLDALGAIPEGATELVILPETSNTRGVPGLDEIKRVIDQEGAQFVDTIRRQSRRIGAVIMAGLMTKDAQGVLRNQLGVFQPDGAESYPFTKNHLVQPEHAKGIQPGQDATPFEINGIRFGAAICFDFYFPELFLHYAKKRVDVIVVVSHQRQEPTDNLEFLTRARAFDSGCTILRAAPAMDDPDIGGRSMAVAPNGCVIADAGGIPGVVTFEFDPHARFIRAASYGEPDKIGDYRETIQPACRPELYFGK